MNGKNRKALKFLLPLVFVLVVVVIFMLQSNTSAAAPIKGATVWSQYSGSAPFIKTSQETAVADKGVYEALEQKRHGFFVDVAIQCSHGATAQVRVDLYTKTKDAYGRPIAIEGFSYDTLDTGKRQQLDYRWVPYTVYNHSSLRVTTVQFGGSRGDCKVGYLMNNEQSYPIAREYLHKL